MADVSVLLVEPEEWEAEDTEKCLRDLGYTVCAAVSSEHETVARGTVRDANTIAVTEETELAFRVDGRTGTINTVCTGLLLRVSQA